MYLFVPVIVFNIGQKKVLVWNLQIWKHFHLRIVKTGKLENMSLNVAFVITCYFL